MENSVARKDLFIRRLLALVADSFHPEGIFPQEALENWAARQGYCSLEETSVDDYDLEIEDPSTYGRASS